MLTTHGVCISERVAPTAWPALEILLPMNIPKSALNENGSTRGDLLQGNRRANGVC